MSDTCCYESDNDASAVCYAEAGPSGLCRDHHEEAWPPIPMRAYDDWCTAHGIPTHDERLKINQPKRDAVLVVKP